MNLFITGIVTGYFLHQIDIKQTVASVMKMYYQMTDHTLEPYNKVKGSHVVRYKYKDEEYKILIRPFLRGPQYIVDIIDVGTDKSVFCEIKPFLGPDGHGASQLSPNDLGYSALIVHRIGGDEATIEGDDKLF